MGQIVSLYGGTHQNTSTGLEEWYKKHTGGTLDRKKYTYILGGNTGTIKALVLYFDYTGHSITMDICAPKALTRQLIKSMFDYPFNQLKVQKLIGFIDQRNVLSQETFYRLGCRQETEIKDFFGTGISRLVYAATKEDVKKWAT